MVKLYRPFSLAAAVIFALVGLVFLFIPDRVLVFFSSMSGALGLPSSPVIGANFYLILAVAYMYLVTLLAYLMYRHPDVKMLPLLLAHAKLASAALSLYLFLTHGPYLIYLANCMIDGLIGTAALFFYVQTKAGAAAR